MATYTEKLLIGICQKIQLQPSSYDLAEQRYNTIADTIQNDSTFYNTELRMYPQGSFRLKTTVKPLAGNEFDLDFVVELPRMAPMTPRQLYDHIYRILSTDGVHNEMIEKKSRCIRVCYANDFHIDIMPGKSINRAINEIIVPDRELKGWYHHSNPIGFAEWFEKQAKSNIRTILFEQRKTQFGAEPITDQEIATHLEPLRRAVQLIKRYRDIYCNTHNSQPVRSIIICTLMGYISSAYSSEIGIISDFCALVNNKIKAAGDKPFEVKNPVVDEVLSEKWVEDERAYVQFVGMMEELTKDVEKLKNSLTSVEIGFQVKKMFGENITNEVIKETAQPISAARTGGSLTVDSSGTLGTKAEGVTVKKNTFYGI